MTTKKFATSITWRGHSKDVRLYHEIQERQYCLKHALNNLLQAPVFSLDDLHGIAKRLAPSAILFNNPHRSLLTGNWDVNVLMGAAQDLGLDLLWWDKRRPLSDMDLLRCAGVILNVPSRDADDDWLIKRWWNGDAGGRHWFALAPVPQAVIPHVPVKGPGAPAPRPLEAKDGNEGQGGGMLGAPSIQAAECRDTGSAEARWTAPPLGEGSAARGSSAIREGDTLAAPAPVGEGVREAAVMGRDGGGTLGSTQGEAAGADARMMCGLGDLVALAGRDEPLGGFGDGAGQGGGTYDAVVLPGAGVSAVPADGEADARAACCADEDSSAYAGGIWYNHDSYLAKAEPIGFVEHVRRFLGPFVAPDADCHVMLLQHKRSPTEGASPG